MEKNRQRRINECLRLVDTSFKLVKDYVKPHIKNTDRHELAKFKLSLDLMRQGKEIYTEVRFKGGKGRCDILVPEDFEVHEIIETEKESEAEKKRTYYPKELNIFIHKALDILK